VNVIIPAAGICPKMKIKGNKSLIDFGDETLIERQIRVVKEVFPEAKITVVLGYESDRFTKLLPAYVKTVINHDFEKTNVVRSLSIAMEYLDSKRKTLFIFGDMVFDNDTINLVGGTNSSLILTDNHDRIHKSEVGVITDNGEAKYFDYSLPEKFAPIFLLGAKELSLFRFFCKSENNLNKCVHEILNTVIDCTHGLKTKPIPKKNLLFEVDCRKDLKKIRTCMVYTDML